MRKFWAVALLLLCGGCFSPLVSLSPAPPAAVISTEPLPPVEPRIDEPVVAPLCPLPAEELAAAEEQEELAAAEVEAGEAEMEENVDPETLEDNALLVGEDQAPPED